MGRARRRALLVAVTGLSAALVVGIVLSFNEIVGVVVRSIPIMPWSADMCEKGLPGANNFVAKANPKLLTDCSLEPWGSAETSADTYFYVTRARPFTARAIIVVPFGRLSQQHLRDFSVVAANRDANGEFEWVVLPARLEGETTFSRDLTIPRLMKDYVAVHIEIKTEKQFDTYGLATFSASKAHKRNYLRHGRGIYVREMRLEE